jgi:predicted ABC-type ATPase
VPTVEKPKLWIVAGPNGSGKTTLYGRTDIEDFGRSVWIINPDLLTAQIALREKLPLNRANAETLNRINRWLHASVKAYRTIGVETVLSTPKYRPLVRSAKRLGFEIRLLYVTLETVDLNISRVRERVKQGGHSVPVAKIRKRRKRSFEQLPWFLVQADFALIYDNSGSNPKLVASKQNNTISIDTDAPEDIWRAALKIGRLS